jgi:hypothetical protein
VARAWIQVGEGRWRLVDTGATAEGTRDNARSTPYVRPERLSAKARRALKIQLGVDIDSESALRAHMRDNDLRFVDRGEAVDKTRAERQRWLKETKPGDRGQSPVAKEHGYSHW